ncbi:hypothetical protein L873DRAFT_1810403 [Choiromyces venosus 120613-1]|uniref:Uncharacterized protein n=1 Tax=Choiromyces venosus 120613-1 TaxID=1336337 RepID=A0A3N4JK48_9PEZI|nr:hypothetical protein L873DRAFT_1810403 [Choiromyces venosus 120613-1]
MIHSLINGRISSWASCAGFHSYAGAIFVSSVKLQVRIHMYGSRVMDILEQPYKLPLVYFGTVVTNSSMGQVSPGLSYNHLPYDTDTIIPKP